MSRNSGLDAIRVLAALAVFEFHAERVAGVSLFGFTGSHGYVGVGAFFVLSGYLVYRPFVWGDVEPRRYLVRRMARIVPAFLVALVGYFALAGALFGIVVTWSLGVEMAFYLTLPLVAILVGGRLRVLAAIGLTSAVVDLVALAAGYAPAFPYLIFSPALLWSFALGMAVAILERRRPDVLRSPLLVPAGLALVVAGLATGGFPLPGVTSGVWLDPLTPLGTALLVAALAARPLRLAGIALAAEVSYPFYLWHVAVLLFLAPIAAGVALATLAFFVASAVSALSVVVVERPVQAWARRYPARRAQAAA